MTQRRRGAASLRIRARVLWPRPHPNAPGFREGRGSPRRRRWRGRCPRPTHNPHTQHGSRSNAQFQLTRTEPPTNHWKQDAIRRLTRGIEPVDRTIGGGFAPRHLLTFRIAFCVKFRFVSPKCSSPPSLRFVSPKRSSPHRSGSFRQNAFEQRRETAKQSNLAGAAGSALRIHCNVSWQPPYFVVVWLQEKNDRTFGE